MSTGLTWLSVESIRDVASARIAAGRLLGFAAPRWAHVSGVAFAALGASSSCEQSDADLLVAAAWVHDIGYAERLAETGFHPLDGARYLRTIGTSERLCRLVANHTSAQVEAGVRDLADALAAEFPPECSPVADALTFADLTTDPRGETTTVEARIAEILNRYGPGNPVSEATRRAAPDLIATVRRVEARLAAATAQPK